MLGLRAAYGLETHGNPDPLVYDCVNYSQIKSWIHNCEENHGPRCNNADYETINEKSVEKLIDVVANSVIDAPVNARYFALSYT
jgi:hypothetical protein